VKNSESKHSASKRPASKCSASRRSAFEDPLFNRGTAFTDEERHDLQLHGQLPVHVSTLEEQVKRRYANFCEMENWVSKHHFLSGLQNRNEILFYRFLLEYVTEMVPFIYTPTVGDISRHYSMLYREQRGLYISYPLRDRMEEMVANYPYEEIDVIVVTDGERILGLGDLGVGGMAISVGKLSLYTLFGGIHPARTLPIVLDVGTNNAQMLSDPLYLGYRSQRVTGAAYDQFVESFISAIEKRFPKVLLQWEDFGKAHAWSLLQKYRDRLCSFNDDIQGTAAVVLAAIYSAVKLSKGRLKDQRIAVLGGGSAGLGICDQIVKALLAEGGMTESEARKLFYVVDIHGLLHTKLPQMDPNQKRFAQDYEKIATWQVQNPHHISLLDVVEKVHPTILIGVSTQAGAFTEEIVREMARHVARPVIFPLSNPNSRSEAQPIDLMKWTNGQAIIATGSPFDPVTFEGRLLPIAQCNNVYIFPGVGLGLIATQAAKASDAVFIEAARVLSHHSPLLQDPYGLLFPSLDTLRAVSREIGIAVAKVVSKEGLARAPMPEGIEKRIDEIIWYPEYPS
jgi:malate dehydrogenase (oxaloacetate-decarboxylating)